MQLVFDRWSSAMIGSLHQVSRDGGRWREMAGRVKDDEGKLVLKVLVDTTEV